MITKAWRAWKRIAQKIGNLQARILLTAFYAVLMFPFGMAVRLLFDPLRVKQRPARWLDSPEETRDFRWAKRQ
ncbi:MAG: hypothetical protein DMG97_07325 [Acidobacteria bacterium]|nr:MAG: hypothetical protein DMG97_07325 [Acidobacteriota bacterium]